MIKKLILIITILLLVGCSGETSTNVSEQNYKQGYTEPTISLLKNAPPDKIFPQSNFVMIANVDNQAAYDITNTKLKILGIDGQYFRTDRDEEIIGTMQGRSVFNPQGDKKYVEFNGFAGQLFQNSNSYTGNIFLVLSYSSKVEFSHTVCINPKLYEVHSTNCQTQDTASFSGQGAPVGVSSIKQIVAPMGGRSSIEFRITIQNSGSGEAKKINLGEIKLGGTKMDCQFKGQSLAIKSINLKKNEKQTTIICKKTLDDQNAYTTTLTMDLTYDYEKKYQHQLRMVK